MLKDYLKNFNRRSGKKQTIFLKYKKIGGEGFFLNSQTYFEFILLRRRRDNS